MNSRDYRFLEAYDYAFGTVFPSFLGPLEKLAGLYREGTEPKARRAYAASVLEFTMLAVKCMTKFHRQSGPVRDSVDHFLAAYFPAGLQWELKKFYRAYEDGMLYYYALDPSLEPAKAEKEIEDSAFSPQRLLSSLKTVIEDFRNALLHEDASDYRARFFLNFEKIRKAIPS